MKKVIRLTESDLMRLVKKVINEQSVVGAPNHGMIPSNRGESLKAKYTTQKTHNLMKNGKTVQISSGDLWKQVGFSAEEFDYMVHNKSNVAFFCDPNERLGNSLGVEKLEQFENSQALSQILRSQFCKGRSFNYDKYPSTECVEANEHRESMVGCLSRYKK
tara:strand:+ start:324 stop:806 length:483 start_codon:yes stop_codon:yes gene_type:complete